jgi:hypothetical protein
VNEFLVVAKLQYYCSCAKQLFLSKSLFAKKKKILNTPVYRQNLRNKLRNKYIGLDLIIFFKKYFDLAVLLIFCMATQVELYLAVNIARTRQCFKL